MNEKSKKDSKPNLIDRYPGVVGFLIAAIILTTIFSVFFHLLNNQQPEKTNWKQYNCTAIFSDGHKKDIIIYKKEKQSPPTVKKTAFSGVLYVESTDLNDCLSSIRTYDVIDLTINSVIDFIGVRK